MQGLILALETGITVVLADHRPGGWYRGIILHSTNPAYRVGGYDIVVGDTDIEKARVITLTDMLMSMLIADAPVHGPIPTIEGFINRINAASATVEGAL